MLQYVRTHRYTRSAIYSLTRVYSPVQCDAIVEAGLPTVVSWINTYENSTVVCNQLRVCSAAVVAEAPKLGDDCSACQTLIGTIEHWLANNATENWIENELMKVVCVAVPSFKATVSIFTISVRVSANALFPRSYISSLHRRRLLPFPPLFAFRRLFPFLISSLLLPLQLVRCHLRERCS